MKENLSQLELSMNQRAFTDRRVEELVFEVESLNRDARALKESESSLRTISETQAKQLELSKAAVNASEKYWEEAEQKLEESDKKLEEAEAAVREGENKLKAERQAVAKISAALAEEREKREAVELSLTFATENSSELSSRAADLAKKLDLERVKVIELIQKHNALKGRRKDGYERLEQDLECSKVEANTLREEIERYKGIINDLRNKTMKSEANEASIAFASRIEVEGVREDNRKHRLRNVHFLSEVAASESRRRALEKELGSARERIVELEDAVKLLQCSQRQYSTPMKSAASPLASPSPVITQVISLREHHDIVNAQRQKLTSLKFEVKTAQQESSAMRQRTEKLEALLGERNESLLKAFHTDSIVEELKSALHLSFERYEHAQTSLAEAERDVAELRRQLDENVDRGVELEQEVIDLREFGEEANRKVEKATLAYEEASQKVKELEKLGEDAARANEDLEAQNESLGRKLIRADVERAEKTRAFYSDVRSRCETKDRARGAKRRSR